MSTRMNPTEKMKRLENEVITMCTLHVLYMHAYCCDISTEDYVELIERMEDGKYLPLGYERLTEIADTVLEIE